MGYFSNGCEGDDYEVRFCNRCVHQKPDDGGCMVWLAHLLHNYGQDEKTEAVLNLLIPRSKDGAFNEQCAMFHESAAVSGGQRP
jgi:hypothetical protein